jgi:putative tricarboxylic transport membrane protein
MHAILARLGREGLAGAFVVAIGLLLYLLVYDYPRGRISEFGPGFVPWAASIGLMLLGAAMLARGWIRPGEKADLAVRPAVMLLPVGMAIFAFGIESVGLALTAAVGVLVASFASRESRLQERLLLSLGLAALVTIIFGYALGMTMPLWPWSR